MTWLKFLGWISGIYIVYYLLVAGWDILRQRSSAEKDDEQDELTLAEAVAPVAVGTSEEPRGENVLFSSGGVNLKQMFNLARDEAIEYVKAVSF
ncbi:hypothetical protein [Mucilaginibacter sp. SJ]|uniref:hypothetical protein n=1 Tax=Mucilaginibacter sp. SJ TaxID=3029053 RepID=UPI0023A989A1|nr:hypothetical protein [Mucilaginibacter sp. SJ]WEA01733.1 hypothetical protein MusilaSJ_02205 [Mucilaginibacter sp. SJ]